MDYIVAWSGSSARNGTAEIKSLSGYLGRSSLFVPETRAPKDTAPARLHEDERRRESVKKYCQRRAEHERQQRNIANRKYRKAHRTQLNAYLRNYKAQKKAQQPDLFGTAQGGCEQ